MISVISLSGTSTTISSSREPSASGSFAACVAANTASPHTFPVVPPQNRMFSGVETTTAASPPAHAVNRAFGNVFINPIRAMIPTTRPIKRLVSA